MMKNYRFLEGTENVGEENPGGALRVMTDIILRTKETIHRATVGIPKGTKNAISIS